jgi:GntR family transcriptional regulator, transcriptional repressor for pyruvate dehydrogenase complex
MRSHQVRVRKEVNKTVTRKTTIAAITPVRAKKRPAARPPAAKAIEKAIETAAKDRSHPRFAPIRTKRVFEEICEQVRREMAAGSLRPGDKLPPERELALKLGVSRAAVREALRSLEIAGVVGLHKGARGGAFILKGDPDLVTRSIRDMFHLGRISLDNLTEARTLVMQVAIELASERIRPTTVAALERNVDRLTTLPPSGKASERVAISAEFYRLISQATDNTVLQVIIEALTDIVLQQVEQSNIEFFPNLIAHRRRLVEYIATRQVDDAKREMTEHLQRLRRHLMRAERTAAENKTALALAEETSR